MAVHLKTPFLLNTIKTIGENNFNCCTLLETINFEGTEAEWNAITNLSSENILEGVAINFESSYNAK